MLNKCIAYRVRDAGTLPQGHRRGYVSHVTCSECLPDAAWLRTMIAAGRLTVEGETSLPCRCCGHEPSPS